MTSNYVNSQEKSVCASGIDSETSRRDCVCKACRAGQTTSPNDDRGVKEPNVAAMDQAEEIVNRSIDNLKRELDLPIKK